LLRSFVARNDGELFNAKSFESDHRYVGLIKFCVKNPALSNALAGAKMIFVSREALKIISLMMR